MEEEVIDLREYLSIIKKKWFIMAILCVVCVAASAVYSFFIAKPVYQAETTLIVKTEKTEGTNTVTSDQIKTTQQLAVTYGEIIKSRKVLDDVIKNLDLDESYGQLSGKISVSTVSDTQIIKISVQDTIRGWTVGGFIAGLSALAFVSILSLFQNFLPGLM